MADLRVGLVGYGHGGAIFHAPLIASTPGLRLAAVVTANPERRAQASHDHPGATVIDTAERLWTGAPQVDLVDVASPNRTHVPLALSAIAAGLPVVVDKPLAPTAAEASRLVDEAHRRGVLLTVFQNRRWDGDFLTVRELLGSGALGEAFRFESRFERWRPSPRDNWRERGDPAEAGGVLYDLGSHLIDQALVLFGPVRDVHAELDRRRPGVQVEDDAFVALTHASGVRSHLWISLAAAQAGPRFRILGQRGGYVKWGLDPQEDALRRGERPGAGGWGEEPPERWGRLGARGDETVVPTRPGAYQRFYEGVVRAIQGTEDVPVDPEDAIAGLRLIEAARRATRRPREDSDGPARAGASGKGAPWQSGHPPRVTTP